MIKVFVLVVIIATTTIAMSLVDDKSSDVPLKTALEGTPETAEEVFKLDPEDDDQKIAIGKPANRTQQLSHDFLQIQFIEKSQNCGGVLINTQWILTSASCLVE